MKKFRKWKTRVYFGSDPVDTVFAVDSERWLRILSKRTATRQRISSASELKRLRIELSASWSSLSCDPLMRRLPIGVEIRSVLAWILSTSIYLPSDDRRTSADLRMSIAKNRKDRIQNRNACIQCRVVKAFKTAPAIVSSRHDQIHLFICRSTNVGKEEIRRAERITTTQESLAFRTTFACFLFSSLSPLVLTYKVNRHGFRNPYA